MKFLQTRRRRKEPAFVLAVRVGKLQVEAHPLLMDWAPAHARLGEGWGAAARHRRRRIATARLYVQVPPRRATAPKPSPFPSFRWHGPVQCPCYTFQHARRNSWQVIAKTPASTRESLCIVVSLYYVMYGSLLIST